MHDSTATYGARTFRGKTPRKLRPIELARMGAGGRDWYARAHTSVVRYGLQTGNCPRRVADVLAITSPRVPVSRNVTMADHYLRTGEHPHGAMKQIRQALDKYEVTRSFGGLKVNAFSDALMNDPDAVVVDVWMIRAFDRSHWKSITPKRYREVVGLIRRTATILGWTAAGTQAAIWTGIRAQYGYVNAGDLIMPDSGGATSSC